MVITVYADRRSAEVGDVAARLAHAIGGIVGESRVTLLGPRVLDAGDAPAALVEVAARYDATVVALTGAPTEHVVAAFDASDRVLLLTAPSVPSIRGAQRTLRLCKSLGYAAAKVVVVLHDFGDDAPLAPHEVALALKRETFWTLEGAASLDDARRRSFAGLARQLLQTGRVAEA